jgi:sporulation protein YlmC with PRC-barrel domain
MKHKPWIVPIVLLSLSILVTGGFRTAMGREKAPTRLATAILDQDVYDSTGNLIGEVEDVIIKRSGKAKKLLVEFGGFFDIGDKLVSLPFSRFDFKDGDIALEVTEEELDKRPEFHYGEEGLRPYYYRRARPATRPGDYHDRRSPGNYPYPPPGPYSYGYRHERPDSYPPANPEDFIYTPSRFLASSVIQRRIINDEGKSIGRVQDLVINKADNTVEKIVLFSENILDEEVYVALAYQPLGFNDYGVVYDIQPEELKKFIYPYKKE